MDSGVNLAESRTLQTVSTAGPLPADVLVYGCLFGDACGPNAAYRRFAEPIPASARKLHPEAYISFAAVAVNRYNHHVFDPEGGNLWQKK